MNILRRSWRLGTVLIAASPLLTSAAILQQQLITGKEWRLSDLGTTDWLAFTTTRDSIDAGALRAQGLADSGEISRQLACSGEIKFGPDQFSDWEFDWAAPKAGEDDGIGNHAQALPSVRLSLSPRACISLRFEAEKSGRPRQAAVWCRPSRPVRVTLRQGENDKTVTVAKAGWLKVEYDGTEPLSWEMAAADGGPVVIRDVAAVVSPPNVWWIRDERFVLTYSPIPQAEFLRRGSALNATDFLQRAQRFAETMLRYGRDHYGAQNSPLFSSSLTRAKEPTLTPYPLYAEFPAKEQEKLTKRAHERELAGLPVNPFNLFYYDRVLNYPKGLGSEGPHKTTVYGADPFEDRDLYTALFELTKATGDPKFKAAATEALTWWYAHTQQSSGLYPWGEHAGWDFEHDMPTYFAGPSKGFFEANYHEVRDFLVYPEFLEHLPTVRTGARTPLDAYALGVWRMHFWNKEKGWFNRHGDINGIVDQVGEGGGFPAHLGYYFRLWGRALLLTEDTAVRTELTVAFNRALDMAISRTEKYGFFPFSFDVELSGADPGREVPAQSLRLAHHAFAVSQELKQKAPEISAKLLQLARLHLKGQSDATIERHLRIAQETGDVGFLSGKEVPPPPSLSNLRDLSRSALSEEIAQEIISNVWYYRDTNRPEYLAAARAYAQIAFATFCDDHSPLPRALRVEIPIRTARGEPFPDFYYRGGRLMRAFALIGEQTPAKK